MVPFCFVFFVSILLIVTTLDYLIQTKEKENSISTPVIAENADTLHVLLFANASDYFIYRGTPIGFQYEMLQALGKFLEIPMNIEIVDHPDSAIHGLLSNKFDLSAIDYPRSPLLSFYLFETEPYTVSCPVLVGKQRLTTDSTLTVCIPAFFPYAIYMDSLPEKHSWKLIYRDETSKELFEKLHRDEIDYLICDDKDALTLLPFYPGTKIVAPAGSPRERCWVVKYGKDSLQNSIDQWLRIFKKSGHYKLLKKKYMSSNSPVIKQVFHPDRSRVISPYDRIVKKYARNYDLDWRFITSIMYQESKFEEEVWGLGGSFGLMQMMPATGRKYGVTEESTPEEQIHAGIKYLHFLHKSFAKVPDHKEQMYFMAAAYNAGLGHVRDAQALCEKHQGNPLQWEEVAHFLTLKSSPEYAHDPVVKCGYYPGKFTIQYVNDVMQRYHAYCLHSENN
jgi:membrane-bound lytic murein transglycosylase F